MKLFSRFLIKAGIFFFLLLMAATGLHAQNPTYLCELRNDYQVSATTFQFDVYLLRTGSTAFEYSSMQFGININSGALNGGVISVSLVPGSSQLNTSQIPAASKFSFNATKNCIIMTATPGPGYGLGTIISPTSPGTRVGTILLTNTVNFGMVQPNLAWSWSATTGYPTKVNAYVGVNSVDITVQASHTVTNLINPTLNKPITAYNVTGTGSYCQMLAGLAVGLSNSELGVTYTLVKDGTPTTTILAGTGSALAFGLQPFGTYTVTAARNGTYITGNMTGSAVVTAIAAVTPAVAIVPSANPVYAGTPVIFTPTPVNGGPSPTFQWFVNGSPMYTGASYTYPPLNGDAVYAVMTSSLSCVTSATATSGTINMVVNPIWTGTISSDWATAGNWNPNAAPGSSLNAYIPSTATNMPVVNQSPGSPAICNNLTIAAGATLTVAAGKALTINGVLTNTATSGIILSSNAAGTATGSLIFSNTGVSGTVQRYVPAWGDISHGWHFLSSPVLNQAIQPTFVPTNPGSAQDFYAWDEVNGWWFNCKDINLNWVPTFDASFVQGKGYLIAYGANGPKSFIGELNVSNISKTGLTRTSPGNYTGDITPGWNLVGNPFTSPITWNTSGWSLSNIAAISKIWNEVNASYTDISASGIIPATQGFMVEVTTGTGSLTIPASSRTHSAQGWYKSTDNRYIKLIAHNIDAQTAQECVVSFDDQATPGYDPGVDSHFLPGYAPSFYSLDGTVKLSTNVLPAFNDQVTVPLGFIKTDGLSFSIEAVQTDNFTGPVYLTDLKLDLTQNLRENPVYNFSAADGDYPGRFLLSFRSVGISENSLPGNGIYAYGNNLYIVNPGKARLEVYNLTGQKLFSDEINNPGLYKTTLYVPTAYYVVRLTTGTKVVVAKVFIKS